MSNMVKSENPRNVHRLLALLLLLLEIPEIEVSLQLLVALSEGGHWDPNTFSMLVPWGHVFTIYKPSVRLTPGRLSSLTSNAPQTGNGPSVLLTQELAFPSCNT